MGVAPAAAVLVSTHKNGWFGATPTPNPSPQGGGRCRESNVTAGRVTFNDRWCYRPFRRVLVKMQDLLPRRSPAGMRCPDREPQIVKPSKSRKSAALLKIALPLIFAYLADVLMVVTTKIVIGKLGYVELAAAGVSADIGFQLAIIVKGLFSAVGVFAAEAYGAGRKDDALVALVRGLALAAVFGLALVVLTLNMGTILYFGGQDPRIIETAKPFYLAFAWSMIPSAFFGVLRSFVSALMRTGFVMFTTVSAVVLNYLLMQGLVHGSFGLPQMGLAGAGWAWSLSLWYMCASLGIYTAWLVRRENLSLHGKPWITGLHSLVPMLKLGLPVAGIVALEFRFICRRVIAVGNPRRHFARRLSDDDGMDRHTFRHLAGPGRGRDGAGFILVRRRRPCRRPSGWKSGHGDRRRHSTRTCQRAFSRAVGDHQDVS